MGTTLIKAKITDQILEFTLKPIVASGGVNEDVIEFEFDELWDGFDTVAVFYRSKREVFHQKIVNNSCTVPSEVLRTQGVFYVGVMGVKDNVTRTTNVLHYELEHGAITAGVEPPKPTPSIYESILSSVKSAEQLAQSVRDDADAGRFNGAPGSDASVTAENIQNALGYVPVKDVQVAGSSVLVDGIANVPIANEEKEGVIKAPLADGTSGIQLDNDNRPCVFAASEADITARQTLYRPLVPARMDYAVKAAMCDSKGAAWTDAEQKAAREKMGIPGNFELLHSITVGEGGATKVIIPSFSALHHIMALVTLPPIASFGFFLNSYLDNSVKSYVAGTEYGNASHTLSIKFEVGIEGGIVFARSCGAVVDWGGGNTIGSNNAGQAVFAQSITSAYLYTPTAGKVIPETTKIEIYGVKI